MRYFFQDFEKDEIGNIIGCKMHDFVQYLSKKECIHTQIVAVEGGDDDQRIELLGDKVRHLTLTSLPKGQLLFPTSFDNCKSVRTLCALGLGITTISPASVLQMKCLRTLNLTNNSLNELPKEIGELIHLRYMDLSFNNDLREIPDPVCDLYNLQTLALIWCSKLEKLPKVMGKLINLKHLYVWGCLKLRYLPKGIRSLKSLQVL